MIGIWHVDAVGYISHVICDCCGQPIIDASRGVAFSDRGKEELPAKHAHKGKCFDTIQVPRGPWMELEMHLAHLVHNSRANIADVRSYF